MKPSTPPDPRSARQPGQNARKEETAEAAQAPLEREQAERQNDRNVSADELGRAPRSNKLSGSGIDVAGPADK
ncbi:hypothetical protein PIGHUM_01165 [Pigmentiphaga humi]|uniref:Uncharacterized protein n=1 Tax=Pigmentiphaga humi TaxID=2478468 RepID=A0A3P4B1U4_9BURK|nr:hypothetical protein [Pigmentiphaga humi]VCU69105.1 hypothetical protein PIGHUM_01165 [Pigmentiphaga humi]